MNAMVDGLFGLRAAAANRLRTAQSRVLGWVLALPGVELFLLLPALVAFGYAGAVVAVRLWYESLGGYNVDTSVYWTVGNGMLHGLTPYRDLFETKPPGIFILSAISFALTGGGHLMNATQVASLLALALAPLAYLPAILARNTRPLERLPTFVALYSLWLVLTAFVGERGREVQVEVHGMFGMVLYLVCSRRDSRLAFWGRVAGVFLAIGLKEPFALLFPAIFLLIQRDLRRAFSDLIAPILVASTIGLTLLALSGWLVPYLSIYLRTMLGGHVGVFGSPWARILPAIGLNWENLAEFSAPLPLTLSFCALLFVLSSGPAATWRLQGIVCGALLAGLAVGLGGNYYPHHHIFAVPVFLALIAGLLFDLQERGGRVHHAQFAVIGLVLLTSALPEWRTVASFQSFAKDLRNRDQIARSAAKVIDDVLDKYRVDRYQWLGPAGFVPLPYTRHMPTGPLFFQQEVFFEGRYQWLEHEFERRLPEAKIVVLFAYNVGPATSFVQTTLADRFRKLPDALPSSFPYTILIRKDLVAE